MTRGGLRGDDVRELRAALRMTFGELADLLGVHPHTVRRWEAWKECDPSVEGLQRALLLELRRQVDVLGSPLHAQFWGGTLNARIASQGKLAGLRMFLEGPEEHVEGLKPKGKGGRR